MVGAKPITVIPDEDEVVPNPSRWANLVDDCSPARLQCVFFGWCGFSSARSQAPLPHSSSHQELFYSLSLNAVGGEALLV